MNIPIQASPESGGRQPTLDFLRGIAILGVVAFHVTPVFDPGARIITSVAALGFQGVQLFFLISAITMCYMWDHRLGESHATLKFYIRRFFRIAPPFWVAMGGYLLLNGFDSSKWAPDGVGARQIITSFFFVNGFWPDTINAVVPGGWSIVDEMTFYAFFPFLISRFKNNAVSYFIGAFLLYLANLAIVQPIYDVLLRNFPHPDLRGEFNFFQFFNQAPVFLLGIFLYASMSGSLSKKQLPLVAGVALLWLGIAFSLKTFYDVRSSPFFWLAAAILMTVVITAFKLQLTFRPVNRLGQLSYSIYLIHFAVIVGVEWCFARAGADKHGLLGFTVALITVLFLCWWLGALLESTLERAASRIGRRLVNAVPAHSAIQSTINA
jgi:exopolysaccharide production protein ExoZ